MTNNGSSDSSDHSKEFISKLTHGARSPFNGLIGFSELLSTNYAKLNESERKDYIFHINMLAKKSLLVLDEFILWFKIRENNLTPGKTYCNLADTINFAISRNQEQFKQKECTVINKFASDEYEDIPVVADPYLLGQAISFLFDYCQQHISKKDKITIDFIAEKGAKKIQIFTSLDDEALDKTKNILASDFSIKEAEKRGEYKHLSFRLCSYLFDIQNIKLNLNTTTKHNICFELVF
jgi:K+-sensing histidine kinase KdpD